jgi:hypothetical protein
MRRYFGNDWVHAGHYWHSAQWEIVTIPQEGGVLPGGSDRHYRRLPALLLLLLAPILGGLFVVFFPFIGFAVVLSVLGKKLLGLVRKAGGIIQEREA